MNFNLHGYKYQVGDIAWILTDELESRSGICVADNGDSYDVLMDDTHGVETFDKSKIFPLKSYTEIKRQTLISPTPTITPSSTPAVTRTPRPSLTPSPTPSVSFATRQNLLNTATTTWTSSEGIISVLAADKLKLTSNIAVEYPVYALENIPQVGVAFNANITVQPHSDYALAFDMDQGSCRFISVKVTRNGATSPSFSQYYMDSSRVSLILNSYDSTTLTITVQLYDDANYTKKARHGRFYTLNRLNMSYIRYNNIMLPTPTPTSVGGNTYDSLILSRNPQYYWSLKNDANGDVGGNPLLFGPTSTLVPDAYGNILNIDMPSQPSTQATAPATIDTYGAKLTNSVSLSTNYTLEAWINLPGIYGYANLFGCDDDNDSGLMFNHDGTLALYGNTDYYQVNFGFTPNTDYHIVMSVAPDGAITMYVNGSKFPIPDETSFSKLYSVDTYNYTFIGNDIYDDLVVGKIGNIAIYNRVLTDAEVTANYHAGTNGYRYTPHTVVTPKVPVYLPYTLTRLNTDGTIDNTYDVKPDQGINTITKFNSQMIIGGEFTAFNPVTTSNLVKLNSDGSLNSTLYPSGGNNKAVVFGTSDGKVYTGNGSDFTRYNSDGTVDTSFVPDFTGTVSDMATDSNGKVYIVGSFSIGSDQGYGILRLNANGTSDSTFRLKTTNNWETVNNIRITADNKLYVYDGFSGLAGTASSASFLRINTDASVDGAFADVGMNGYNIGFFEQAADGKIYLGGSNSYCMRLNSDGTLDSSYTVFTSYNGNSAMKQVNGDKIYISYYDYGATYPYGILRLNSDGTLDGTYTSVPTNDNIVSIAVSNDYKVYMSGPFTTAGGHSAINIARLNTDGTLDTTYTAPTIGGAVDGVILTKIPNGQIFITGSFHSVGGTLYQRMASLQSDGTLDTSFNSVYIDNTLFDIKQVSTGKIYYNGNFNTGASSSQIYASGRLNSDGTYDNTMTVPSYTGGSASLGGLYQILESSDGKVYVNYKITYSGTNPVELLRYNSDGTRDASYASPIFSSNVYSMYQTSDGKIYVGGSFKTVSGNSYNQLCRLNSDGTLDTTFTDVGIPVNGGGGQNTAMFANNAVASIIQDVNGKIYIGGDFSSVGASTSPYIARLNSDGTVDSTFGVAIANSVSKLFYIDNKVYIVSTRKLNRLNSDGTLDTNFEYTTDNHINHLYKHTDGKIYIASDSNYNNGSGGGVTSQ